MVAADVVVEPPALPGQLSFTTVDIPTFEVDRAITIDGAAPPASQIERGDIVLVGAGSDGDEVDLGSTHEPSPTLRVIPGPYDVYYRGAAGWTAVPGNRNARIASSIRIDEDETVAVDIPTVELAFDLTVDGAPFVPSQLERGRISLVGSEPEDVLDLGPTHQPLPTPRVVAGTYDLVYDWEAGSVLVPRNVGYHFVREATWLVDETVVADIDTKIVIPTFSLDGAPFPSDPSNAGEIVLRDGDGGEVPLGSTAEPLPDDVRVVEDAYAVDYLWSAGIEVPLNPRQRVGLTSVPEPASGVGVVSGIALSAAVAARRARGRAPRPRPSRA